MTKWLVVLAAALIVLPLGLMVFAAAQPPTLAASTSAIGDSPTSLALADIPPSYLALYMSAARICHGLGWPVLAGIGKVESDHGQSAAPGVHSGANFADAEGPMQFEPGTFAMYAVNADPGHPLSPYDPADAIYSAARLLCASGASGGSAAGIRTAIFAYNHASWYVSEVLSWAARYASTAVPAPAQAAIAYAEAQLGKPYQWGADGPDSYDCSGLVYAAYLRVGIRIARTTFDWRQDGPVVPLNQIQPGDLLFSAGSDGTPFSWGQLRTRRPSDCVSAAQRLILSTLPCATGVVQVCYRRVAWLSCVMSSRLAVRAAWRSWSRSASCSRRSAACCSR
jgi:cell wall-associated NlpC family hydrolase